MKLATRVPMVPMGAGAVVLAMFAAVLVRAGYSVRRHIGESGIGPELENLVTIIEWTAGAVVAVVVFTFVMRVVVEGLRRVANRAGRWPVVIGLAIVGAGLAIAIVAVGRMPGPRAARLAAGVQWWSLEIGIVGAMALVLWLTVKDTVEGFFRYPMLAAVAGVLAGGALIFAFVFIVAACYLPGWAMALAGIAVAAAGLWLGRPYVPMFLAVVAFAATMFTMPWIADWQGVFGFILWLLTLVLTLARADKPSQWRWFAWAEPFAWIAILFLTARQWGLLR